MAACLEKLKAYLENSSACQTALQPLNKKIEIGLILDQNTVACVTRHEGGFLVLPRPAERKDVQFSLSNDAVDRLCLANPDNIAEIAVQLIREIKNGEVKIKVTANLFSLLKNGYLEIIAKGGKPMWNYLSDHGITSPKKIISIFKGMVK